MNRRGWLCLATLAASVWSDIAMAQVGAPGSAAPEGIAVTGSGDVRARPNAAEITVRVVAQAQLTNDALQKFRDAKRRVLKAITDLKMANLEVSELGVMVHNASVLEQMNMGFNPNQPVEMKSKTEVTCAIRLRLKGIQTLTPDQALDALGKALDAAADAGALLGPSANEINQMRYYGYARGQNFTMARFVLEDFDEHRDKAYQLAVADARERAERLAKLYGVKLGAVSGIQEIQSPGDAGATTQPYYYPMPPTSVVTDPKTPQIASDALDDISVKVRLIVRFDIEK